jgi:deoxyribodipyrimidine photo-lyase
MRFMIQTVFPPAFDPTRKSGLDRLVTFLPNAGQAYATNRNTDYGLEKRSNVSGLSPYIRHRMITESEVLKAVFSHHSFADSEKFIQEVFWRSYFKGYLEARPQIWRNYQLSCNQQIATIQAGGASANGYQQAIAGKTGIDCFDAWVNELVETGYLHNHARMWFASIWIFTLKLPWELGADFTFRHFMDGDPASNTLSWRWVGGLHTKGKTYLARAENIRAHTNGRFDPKGLSLDAAPLDEPSNSPALALPELRIKSPPGPAVFLLTEEDLHPESLDHAAADIRVVVACQAIRDRSVLPTSGTVLAFIDGALADGAVRAGTHFNTQPEMIDDLKVETLVSLAKSHGVSRILTAYTPVGPLQDKFSHLLPRLALEGIELVALGRREDQLIWPHATKGFFALKERIPDLIRSLGFAA